MKKSKSKLLVFAALILAVSCVFGFVACGNPDGDAKHTLTFVTNGGTSIPAITAAAGESITVPADPVKDNAEFDGWYLTPNFTGDKVTVPSIMPSEDITYYAKFTGSYTLTFETNGGSVVSPVTKKAGESVPAIADPIKANAEFDGWYLTPNFTGDKVTVPTVMPSEDKTYYAKFLNKYTLTFETNGGTVIPAMSIAEGKAVTAPADPEKDNAVFAGWFDNEELYGTAVDIPATMPSANKTYYAKFLGYCTVSYDANLPTGVAVSGETPSGRATETLPMTVADNGFTAVGYRFVGWSTTADGEVNVGKTVTVTADTTLYAVWNKGYKNKNSDDYLFIEGSSVVLVTGDKEYVGTYNAAEKLFEVNADGVVMGGRLFENNTYSLYGEYSFGVHALYNAYTDAPVSGGTALELFDNKIAEYGDTRGVYEYIGDSSFTFTANDESTAFVFKRGVNTDDENVYYVRGDEYGTYTLYGGKSILMLDGYGNGGQYTMDGDVVVKGDKRIKVSGEYYAEYNEALAKTYSNGTDTLVLDGYMGATLGTADGLYSSKTVDGIDGVFVTVNVADNIYNYKLNGENYCISDTVAGKYEQYENGTFVSPTAYLYLNGDGNAQIDKKNSSWSSAVTTQAVGTYVLDAGSADIYVFTPNSEYESYGIKKFKLVERSNGTVFIVYNEAYAGTYTSGEDTLVLDGYGNATYTKVGGTPVTDSVKVENNTIVVSGITITLNSSDNTFTAAGAEKLDGSGYWNNDNSGTSSRPRENDLRMQLDGNGNAIIQRYECTDYMNDIYDWTNYATGTYVSFGNEIWQFTPNTSSATKMPAFKFMLERFPNTYYVEDESRVASYTNGNQTIVVDGFGYAVYSDATGGAHRGTYSASGDYATLTCDDATYLFKITGETFISVGNEKGDYTLDGGSSVISLDGEGNATLTTDGVTVEGNYSSVAGTDDEYDFTSESLTFTFRVSSKKYVVAYEHADTYLSANDFRTLKLDKYGIADYTDETGAIENGTFVMLSEHIACYTANGASSRDCTYFRLNYENGTFVIDEDEFVVENNVLVAYTGNKTELKISDGITAIADGVFAKNTALTAVDLNNVRIIGKGAFEDCENLASVIGLNVTEVGIAAFKSNSDLISVTFGDKVAKIGDEAFVGVSSSLKAQDLSIVIKGNAIPEIGSSVFSYSDNGSTFRVDSLAVALSWFKEERVSAYRNSITFGTDSFAVVYYDLSDWSSSKAIKLSNGRALRASYDRWLYTIDGNNLTLYAFDESSEDKYTTVEIEIAGGLFVFEGKTYAVSGTAVTYTDADDNALVVTLGETLNATYNGTQVEISSNKFDITLNGNDYTVTLSQYSATSTAGGTFKATMAFKPKTFYLNELNGTSKVTIKQTSENTFETVSGGSVVVDGSSNKLYGGRWEIAKKTDYGFLIIDLNSSSKPYIYKLTLTGDDKFTVLKDTFTTVIKDLDDNSGGAKIYLDSAGNVVHVVLRLKSSSTSSSLSEYVQDYKSDYTVQADGSYLFENITAPSWLKGKSYVVTLVKDDGGAITGATVIEKTE